MLPYIPELLPPPSQKALEPAKYNGCESYPHFLHIVIYKKPGLTHEKILLDPGIR